MNKEQTIEAIRVMQAYVGVKKRCVMAIIEEGKSKEKESK